MVRWCGEPDGHGILTAVPIGGDAFGVVVAPLDVHRQRQLHHLVELRLIHGLLSARLAGAGRVVGRAALARGHGQDAHLGHVTDPVGHEAAGGPAHDGPCDRRARAQEALGEIGRAVGHEIEDQPFALPVLGDHLDLDAGAQGDQAGMRIVAGAFLGGRCVGHFVVRLS